MPNKRELQHSLKNAKNLRYRCYECPQLAQATIVNVTTCQIARVADRLIMLKNRIFNPHGASKQRRRMQRNNVRIVVGSWNYKFS